MHPCQHPLAALKFEEIATENSQVTVRLSCSHCNAPVTKSFLQRTPEPASCTQPQPSQMPLMVMSK